ncbi:hypothetical protein B0H17DRAFT_1194071 [Mycena rosella]|uniref:Uncharacterized protein n=1 Tax=Mycena rosella TaxID=1033263 RepID=A0AAD7E138_MYCRO|nr:hypothetical protein B0H17DRAFT_1194071 [Mycena rosella]
MSMPAICSLTLSFSTLSPDSLAAYQQFATAATLDGVNLALTNLKEMCLQGAMPKWLNGHLYAFLRGLSLHRFRGPTVIAWVDVQLICSEGKNLVGLRLDQVECRDMPLTDDHSLPIMKKLVELHLNVFNGLST